MKYTFTAILATAMTVLLFAFAGCGSSEGVPPGALVGRAGPYDYSPSAIQTGNQIQIWWCGLAHNPQKTSQFADAILYASIDVTTGIKSDPVTVLGETPGAWDSVFTCNPRVIRGSFVNPLGDGTTYTYAMYYVATADPNGLSNSIGVAFSNDGIQWKKYPSPVVLPDTATHYGVGQPVIYNLDGKSNLIFFYENISFGIIHVKMTSSDGIHFTPQGIVTRNGLDPNNPEPSWGDMAYDSSTGYWYAGFNLASRDPASTGGVGESGQYGFELYRIPDYALLTGTTPWQQMRTFDTNATGYESNFLAGFLKDPNGNLNVGAYPMIQIYPSIANPQSRWDDSPKTLGNRGALIQWDIGSITWMPDDAPLTLTRYTNSETFDTTTGYIDPHGHFFPVKTIAHLYPGPQNAATVPLFNCKKGSEDYFISLDPTCEASYIVGLEGYAYPSQVPSSVPIYSCLSAKHNHFASQDSQCEGSGAGTLLGYALP